jgi:death on curing protein
MMRYLSLLEVLELHRQIIKQSGGAVGIRDLGLLESAIAQPFIVAFAVVVTGLKY